MALSATVEIIDSGTVGKILYDLAFEGPAPSYLEKAHIFLWVNDVQVDVGGGTGPDGFTWITESRVQLKTYVPVLDDKIEFRRTIPKDDVYRDFVDGAGITETQLDEQNLANLYSIHEIMDGYGTGIISYYNLAKAYANAAEDVEVETGFYSSKHFSLKSEDEKDAAAVSAAAALVSENNAGTSETNAAASESAAAGSASAASGSAGAAASSESAASGSAAAAATSETNASGSASAAAISETNAGVSEVAAELAEDNALVSENNAETAETSAAASAAAAAASAATTTGVSPNRNCVQNQEAVSQGKSSDTGVSSTKYTGTGASLPVATGIDMATGDFGGLAWVKNRDNINNHGLFDTVRGAANGLVSNTTSAEGVVTGVSAFTATGFTLGAHANYNANGDAHIAWSFQTNKKTSGLTNRNKAYTCHYNADMGFSIVGYVGDGVDGHEIPHHLGRVPELSIFKNRDDTDNWIVVSSLWATDEYCQLNAPQGLAIFANVNRQTDSVVQLPNTPAMNETAENLISYHFTSIPGVSKIGKYIGTAVGGNYVDCGFKAGFVLVKNLTTAADWVIIDTMRPGTPDATNELYPNESDAEVAATNRMIPTADGFHLAGSSVIVNAINDEYLFMAFAETDTDANKAWTDYEYPTAADTISVAEDSVLSFASGFDQVNGQIDYKEYVGFGITFQIPAGNEDERLWVYKDWTGSYGVTSVRPLEGWKTRDDADKWGVVSPLDATLRTTVKHFDYESETGVVMASSELSGYAAHNAFNKIGPPYADGDSIWLADTATVSQLQYKGTERRILKSWRFREAGAITQTPERFTIEGSNDGLNWVAIDSTYTAADYTGNGADLWGNLHETATNTVAYLYHRISITANNGHATLTVIQEMEFNTILPADYFLVEPGVMYNSAGTPIERIYLAEVQMNSDNEIIWYENLPIAKGKFGDVEVHGVLKAHGDILNIGVATAWVNFDGTQNPPLIRDSYNVKDVVDMGTGWFRVVFNEPMQRRYAGSVADDSRSIGSISGGSSIYAELGIYDASMNAADQDEINVIIFGGKEI